MTTENNTVDLNALASLVEAAHRAVADVERREEEGKPTKAAQKAATKACAAANAVLVEAGFDERPDTDDAEAWSGVWADVLEEAKEANRSRGMAGTLARYKPNYKECVAYSGAASQNNGDPLATALEGKTPDEVMAWAEKLLGLEEGFLAQKYASLNPGQKRMNSGNRVRAALKRGDLTEDALKA